MYSSSQNLVATWKQNSLIFHFDKNWGFPWPGLLPWLFAEFRLFPELEKIFFFPDFFKCPFQPCKHTEETHLMNLSLNWLYFHLFLRIYSSHNKDWANDYQDKLYNARPSLTNEEVNSNIQQACKDESFTTCMYQLNKSQCTRCYKGG